MHKYKKCKTINLSIGKWRQLLQKCKIIIINDESREKENIRKEEIIISKKGNKKKHQLKKKWRNFTVIKLNKNQIKSYATK